MNRTARVERVTKETRILVELDLDGLGVTDIGTGVPFTGTARCHPASYTAATS